MLPMLLILIGVIMVLSTLGVITLCLRATTEHGDDCLCGECNYRGEGAYR